MNEAALSKNSITFGLALALTSVVNAIIVVAKEKSAVVMDGMKRCTGHHWTTHTLLVLGIFVGSAWVFGRANQGRGPEFSAVRLVRTLVSGVVIAAAIIIGFYLLDD